jgi:hypothetical protein
MPVGFRTKNGVRGFEPIGSTLRGAQAFKVKGATVVIYESQFAGTNKATAVTTI